MITPAPVPIPSQSSAASTSQTPLSPRLVAVVPDEKGVHDRIEQLLAWSGLTLTEAAERLGVRKQSLHQYIMGRRSNPSVLWLARFCTAVGARVMIELPIKSKR